MTKNKLLQILKNIFIAALFLGSSPCLSAMNIDSMPLHLAVGSCFKEGIQQPLLIKRDNLTDNWMTLSTLTQFDYGAYLNDVTCTNEACIIAGSIDESFPPVTRKRLVLLTSYDQGSTWKTINIAGLPSMVDGYIARIICQDKICHALGYYRDNRKPTLPLLLTSSDGGRSWSYNRNLSDLPSTLQEGGLNTITCTDNFCIAAGTYIEVNSKNNQKWLPLILMSYDYGMTWSGVKDIKGLPQIQFLRIKRIQCKGETCVIAGEYDFKNVFLISSQNKGKSWTFSKELPELADTASLYMEDLTYTNGLFIVGLKQLAVLSIFASRAEDKAMIVKKALARHL